MGVYNNNNKTNIDNNKEPMRKNYQNKSQIK